MTRGKKQQTTLMVGALSVVMLLTGCGGSVRGQDVPSAGDDPQQSVPAPTSAAVLPQDNVTLDPQEVDTTDPVKDGIAGLSTFFGVTPENVAVPQEVKDNFPDNYQTVVRYVLAEQADGTSLVDFQDPAQVGSPSRDIYAQSLDTYMTKAMQDKYHDAFKNYSDAENFFLVFQLSPLVPSDGVITSGGEKFSIDSSRQWATKIENVTVDGVDTSGGLSGNDGVRVTLDRYVYIPLQGQDFDFMIAARIQFYMVPSVDTSWAIDTVAWNQLGAQKVDRQ